MCSYYFDFEIPIKLFKNFILSEITLLTMIIAKKKKHNSNKKSEFNSKIYWIKIDAIKKYNNIINRNHNSKIASKINKLNLSIFLLLIG